MEEDKMKKMWSLFVLFVIGLLSTSMVSALDSTNLEVNAVKINGDNVDFNAATPEILSVEEGQTIDIRVKLAAGNAGAKDVEVDAKINYEYSDYENLYDSTHRFDIKAGTTKYADLEIKLPNKLEKKEYWLRLRVLDDNTEALNTVIKLNVEPARHALDISDVSFSPGNTVKAGRSLLTTVLLENFGDKNQKDVKVSVKVPELGIQATEYVDEVNTDNSNIDREDVEEMFLPIPATAKAGEYEVVVTAEYDYYEKITKTYKINVIADERFQNKDQVVLAVGPDNQNVAAGKSAIYGVALTNEGTTSKAYTIEVATGGWANAKVSENLVVLSPGMNKVVYVELTPTADTVAGSYVASLTVKSGSDTQKTVVLKANVLNSEGNAKPAPATSKVSSLRNGLEIVAVVLVVVLVILGLIIGFSRLKKDEEEEQTYY